jgi:hypothetical protein
MNNADKILTYFINLKVEFPSVILPVKGRTLSPKNSDMGINTAL